MTQWKQEPALRMKRHPLCWSPQGLGLFRATEKSIMPTVEHGIGRQRHAQFEPVSNHPLERGPFLLPNGQAARWRRKSVDRALPRLLATGLRIDLPARLFRNRRPGFNPGFLRDVT